MAMVRRAQGEQGRPYRELWVVIGWAGCGRRARHLAGSRLGSCPCWFGAGVARETVWAEHSVVRWLSGVGRGLGGGCALVSCAQLSRAPGRLAGGGVAPGPLLAVGGGRPAWACRDDRFGGAGLAVGATR